MCKKVESSLEDHSKAEKGSRRAELLGQPELAVWGELKVDSPGAREVPPWKGPAKRGRAEEEAEGEAVHPWEMAVWEQAEARSVEGSHHTVTIVQLSA